MPKHRSERERITLPEPASKYGYTPEQIEEILDGDDLADFREWMSGQTMALIDGSSVVYAHDLARFVLGLNRGDRNPRVWD